MQSPSFRSLLALSLVTLLGACGGSNELETAPMPVLAQSALPPAAVGATPALTQGAGAQAAFNQAPQPDCAADGCKALRIIDANAELYRLAALQRAEDEASSGPEQ